MGKKFDPKKIEKLNNPKRLESIPPDFVWEKLNLSEAKTIVDIGSGTGLFSTAFSKFMDNGKVYALDISEVMVEWMKKNLVGFKNVIPMIMSESEIPFEEKSSDLVIMISLHHELESPDTILAESMRILKAGGKICIIDWKKEETPYGPSYEIRYPIQEIYNQLEAVGFSEIQTDISLERFNMLWAEKPE